jgi:hypothetical protein
VKRKSAGFRAAVIRRKKKMEKSPTISELAKALVAFQKEMKTVGFDAKNPFFKSEYATLSNLVEESKAILAKNGLAVSQLTEDAGAVTTVLMHTSGEYLSSKLTLKPVKEDPQGLGSCITYARRYAYAAILGLVSDKDDDGNAASHTHEAPKETPKTQPRPAVTNGTNGTKNGTTKSVKDIVIELGKQLFKDSDAFKLWRVDNKYAESLVNVSEYEASKILMGLRELESKNEVHK